MHGRPRHLRVLGCAVVVIVGAVLAVLTTVPAASGQEPPGPTAPPGPEAPTATADADPAAIALFGELEDPEAGPVEGVRIEVRSGDDVVGEAESGADGAWRVEVPGPGRYTVALDEDSLPDDVALRDADRATLEGVRVLAGRDKRVNFSLGERVGGGTSSNRFVNQAWSGIVIGLVIALAAVGLSLVFGTTGLVNFAHGEMLTLGALVAWYFNSGSNGLAWPLFVAGGLAVVACALFGAVQNRLLWRPLERRRLDLVSMMIVSIGLAMMLRYLFVVVFEASPRPFRQFSAQAPWTWGPLQFPPKQLAVAVLAVVVLLLYAVALQRTRLGTAVRAVSDNKDLSESSGIDVQRVVLIVWLVGSALAGLGGVAFATLNSVEWDMGFRLLLPVFAAVVLGGLGTAYGPLVGGLAIGLVSELSTLWFPAEFKFAWGLAALIGVLLVRPQGILGRPVRIG
jgi:neutral amino acid transport system permease protein